MRKWIFFFFSSTVSLQGQGHHDSPQHPIHFASNNAGSLKNTPVPCSAIHWHKNRFFYLPLNISFGCQILQVFFPRHVSKKFQLKYVLLVFIFPQTLSLLTSRVYSILRILVYNHMYVASIPDLHLWVNIIFTALQKDECYIIFQFSSFLTKISYLSIFWLVFLKVF